MRRFAENRAAVSCRARVWAGHEGHAFFGELFGFFDGCGAVNRPLGGFAFVNLLRFFGESRADVFEVLLDVMMHAKQHFLKFRRRSAAPPELGPVFFAGGAGGCSFFTCTAQAWGTFSTLVVPQVGQEMSFLSACFWKSSKLGNQPSKLCFFLQMRL